MTLPPWLRRGGRVLFRGVAVLALLYVLRAVGEQWSAISGWRPGAGAIGVLLGTVGAYGASLFILAEMWHRLISACHGAGLPRRVTIPSHASTQIAKYLPGNVFHLVGRHVWLAGEGVAHGDLALALIAEIAGLLIGASIVACAGILAAPATAAALPLPAALSPSAVRGVATAVLVATAVAIGAGLAMLRTGRKARLRAGLVVPALGAAFFVGQAAIFFLICRTVTGEAGMGVAVAAVIAWIVGFVTPGAPGGLGMREFVLLLLLEPAMAEGDALIAIALFRGVTTLGDLLCFGASRLVPKMI